MSKQECLFGWGKEKNEESPSPGRPISRKVPSSSHQRNHRGRLLRNSRKEGTSNAPKDIEKAQALLPSAIDKKKKYASERELRTDLEAQCLDDLPIVLDQQGFPIWRETPGDEHHGAVDMIKDLFEIWKDGRFVIGTKHVNVYVDESFNRNEKRCPDFAIYGSDRMEIRRGHARVQIVNGKKMNPTIIIQFSWSNDVADDAATVDDMMHFAGVGEYEGLGRPNSAYLIQALRRGKEKTSPLHGFNIFRVGRDQDTPEEPTMTYRCGAEEDTEIVIQPAEIGLGDGEPFKIAIGEILEEIRAYSVPIDQARANE